jgi:2-hydroxy-3-keto-5-methylthiopentenyl-1-phosphate phosphatase
MHLYCDFDGTISIEDVTDVILTRFAAPEWQLIEEEWKQGAMGSAECMRRQIALISASPEMLDKALDTIAIDPSFPAFIDFCASRNIPVTVISDGVDYFIRRVLARYHLSHLPIIANRLSTTGENSYALSSPFSDPDCESAAGVCKCRSVSGFETSIYIGDGRSDFCVSNKPDMVFAKDKLATFCAQQDIAYIPYHSFSDITQSLRRTLPDITRSDQEHRLTAADYIVA